MTRITISAMTLLAISSTAVFGGAEEEHGHFDAWVFVEDGRLKTGGAEADEGEFETHVRVFESELGEASPNFADEPGFYSETLPPGLNLSFNIVDSLRVWNGTDFNTTASVDMTLWEAFGVPGSDFATTPVSPGGSTTGFDFATADGTGFIDDHPEFVLNAPATDGVYLLTMQLTSPGYADSLPFFIVFNQNRPESEHEAAADYAASLVPAPGAVALFGLVGAGAIRRRR